MPMRWLAMDAAPLILTLKLDAASFERFDGLRRRWFPPGLNHIPAHLTLFHKLRGEELDDIVRQVAAAAPPPLALQASGVRKLGRGVAYEIAGAGLGRFRGELATLWAGVLTAQDRQAFRPHVTIQNKVDPAQADALYGALRAGFEPFPVTGEGVYVWRYLGGPWDLAAEVEFRPAA